MRQENNPRISHQAVGAYGEKVVEAELLRLGWMPSNVNASIKNSEDFDIFALKGNRSVHLRVKTCGPDMNAFQFGGFRLGEGIMSENFSDSDFTILVRMGDKRQNDQFYVIPTHVVRKTINDYRNAYLELPRRDGGSRKDTGHWTLHLPELRSGEDRESYGFERKWASFLDNWTSLDGAASDLPPVTSIR